MIGQNSVETMAWMVAYWELFWTNGQRLFEDLLGEVIVESQDDELISAQAPPLNGSGSIWVSLDYPNQKY
jgi:hypothetical protein